MYTRIISEVFNITCLFSLKKDFKHTVYKFFFVYKYKLCRHRVPAPFSIIAENTNSNKLGINNQKEILFSLGNAISGPPTKRGNKKFNLY